MTTHISILRGINVSGQKLIKMDALQKMFQGLKFENVRTYVQSGNVVFTSKEKDTKKLEKTIFAGIKSEFGFDVPVVVLNVKTLETVIENNPLSKDKQNDVAFLHVTFLADSPTVFDKEIIRAKKLPGEKIEFASDAVYLYCPGGYGKTKLTNNFLENTLKVKATTRNWKTTNELLKIATIDNEI